MSDDKHDRPEAATLLGDVATKLIGFVVTVSVYTLLVRAVWNNGLVPVVPSLREANLPQASWLTTGLLFLRFAFSSRS